MLSSLRPGVAALVTARLATLGVVATALAACGPADGAPAEALGEGAAAIKGGEKDELDTAGVANRKQSRSKYGAKRPKAATK